MTVTRRTAFAVTASVLSALALSACGATSDPTTSPTVTAAGANGSPAATLKINTSPEQNPVRATKVDSIAALVPADIRSKGKLTVGLTSFAPPLSFLADDNKTVIGNEPDTGRLVADVLGLEYDPQVTSWENLFLGTETGKYDVAFSNITVTEERKDTYDFATYRVDQLAWEVPNASKVTSIKEPKDVAGLTVAVGSATTQEAVLVAWDKQNVAAGLKPVKFQYFQNQADTYLALRSGRIDAYFAPSPDISYHAATSGETKVVGYVPGGGDIPASIAAMTKKDNGLVKAVAAALNQVISDGTYAKVLERWGLTAEAKTESVVNPEGLPRKNAA